MGLRQLVWLVIAALAPAAFSEQGEFWKLRAGDPVDLAAHKFYLPGSDTLELSEWKDKAVLLIYVQTADPNSTEFAKLFEQKAWPAIREKNIVCYFVSRGEPASLIAAWAERNGISAPVAHDGSAKLHSSLTDLTGGFPHLVLLDKNHLFCAGIVGGVDPASEQFLQLVDAVIDQGYVPAAQ